MKHQGFRLPTLGKALLVMGATLTLSACGDTGLGRAITGGAIGCAAGEVFVDGKCAEGAVIGAGVAVLTE